MKEYKMNGYKLTTAHEAGEYHRAKYEGYREALAAIEAKADSVNEVIWGPVKVSAHDCVRHANLGGQFNPCQDFGHFELEAQCFCFNIPSSHDFIYSRISEALNAANVVGDIIEEAAGGYFCFCEKEEAEAEEAEAEEAEAEEAEAEEAEAEEAEEAEAEEEAVEC